MKPILRYWILLADLLWVITAFLLAHWLRYRFTGLGAEPRQVLLPNVLAVAAALFVWTVLYFSKNLEGFSGGWNLPKIFSQEIVAALYLMGALLSLALLMKFYFPGLVLVYVGLLLPIGPIVIRCAARWLVISRARTWPKRRIVILGTGQIVRELAVKISNHPEMSMEVVGVLFPSDIEPYGGVSNFAAAATPVRTLNILNLLQQKNVQELIVVEPLPPGPEAEKLISTCRKAGMRVHLVPQHYELYLSKVTLTEIDDVPILTLEGHSLSRTSLKLKRAIDLLLGSVLLILSSPLLALSAIALCRKRGTAFRKELRCGKNGNQFWMCRLNIDRDSVNLNNYERFLAQFSFTELPQLWNVLKGEMSLVGPRPEPPERVKHYSMWQRQRLNVTPGLTGLAQVNGLREGHSSQEKAHFDLQYISRCSIFVDLSLVLQTAWALFARIIDADRFAVAPMLSSPPRRS
jgi:lipopolysaccharide/colanic/teichoic acid biosynthesis glycosyltransferase